MEVHQALQAAMDKLQQRFTSLMQEKADLKERVEELEHRCIQLSGETDTIGETLDLNITLFKSSEQMLSFTATRIRGKTSTIEMIVNQCCSILCVYNCVSSGSRRVHRPVPEPTSHHEAEAP